MIGLIHSLLAMLIGDCPQAARWLGSAKALTYIQCHLWFMKEHGTGGHMHRCLVLLGRARPPQRQE